MPFGFGKKEEVAFTTDLTDKDDLEEIQRIAHRLDADEKVVIVARQSRLKPGGSKMTPDTIFVTDRRIIIRNPSALGMRESIEAIAFDKITAMELERGMMSSTIKIRASGYRGTSTPSQRTRPKRWRSTSATPWTGQKRLCSSPRRPPAGSKFR